MIRRKVTDMSSEVFTGKAEAYAKARPGYPKEAIDYICSLAPQNAVFADIGAGTGKFTVQLAVRGLAVLAIEPNADMREQLTKTLAPFVNVKIISGTAEDTTLPDESVDIITCAQALHWFEPNAFRAECRRIGKPGCKVITIYNNTPGGNSVKNSKQSTEAFYTNPIIREFANPTCFTRESWLTYMTSHSHDPLPGDSGYEAHIAEVNAKFDKESVDGFLRFETVTTVYWELLDE